MLLECCNVVNWNGKSREFEKVATSGNPGYLLFGGAYTPNNAVIDPDFCGAMVVVEALFVLGTYL